MGFIYCMTQYFENPYRKSEHSNVGKKSIRCFFLKSFLENFTP